MRPLDLDQLRTLVAVCDTGSLTAAGARVALSQSAVSEQMRKLEERVGSTLLARGRAGARPTPAGARLAVHARRLLAQSDEALADLHGATLEGRLRVGVTDYFRPGDIARLLARLHAAYPGIRLAVVVQKSDAVEAAYAAGELDVAVSMRLPQRRGRTRGAALATTIRDEALVWLAATGMLPVPGEPLPLVVLPDTCALHRFTLHLLRSRRVPHTIAHVASGVAGMQSALAAGLGVACLNESATCDGVERLRGHRLPALPRVAFTLLRARAGESPFVTRARACLAAALA